MKRPGLRGVPFTPYPYHLAAAKVRLLGIRTKVEYRARFVEAGGHLPSDPELWYEEWVGWGTFLGTGRTYRPAEDTYPTHKEASAAVQRMGIRNWGEYKRRYREDPRLPSHPEVRYADAWLGGADFLHGLAELILAEVEV